MPTINRVGNFFDKSASRERRIGTYVGPASYTTGGDSLLPEHLSLGMLDLLQLENASNGTVILCLKYDYTALKVKWFDLAGAEVAAATNLSTYSARFEAVGH